MRCLTIPWQMSRFITKNKDSMRQGRLAFETVDAVNLCLEGLEMFLGNFSWRNCNCVFVRSYKGYYTCIPVISLWFTIGAIVQVYIAVLDGDLLLAFQTNSRGASDLCLRNSIVYFGYGPGSLLYALKAMKGNNIRSNSVSKWSFLVHNTTL